MRLLIKGINLFFLLLITPLLGMVLAFLLVSQPNDYTISAFSNLTEDIDMTKQEFELSSGTVKETRIEAYNIFINATIINKEYQQQLDIINQSIESSRQQAQKADIVLEQVLSNLLGKPISIHEGVNSSIKIYTLDGIDYRGYMAKITPHTSEATKIILADDQIASNGEKTSKAAERTGGILAVNAGGFWYNPTTKKIAPVGTTVVDGKIRQFSLEESLTFVGFNKVGKLIGKQYKTEDELLADNIMQGASFKPTLLQNGKKVKIPSAWAHAKHPRTIIGSFSNDDILVIVIDGRRTGWSSGVTLEEVQDKLLDFKIKNAYNLDGGGSSSIYYDGKILNRPSDGQERSVTTNLIIMP